MNAHLSFKQLCDLLDGKVLPHDTTVHAERCLACSDRLASLRSQAEAMRMLATRQGVIPHRGSILGAAREAGMDCLCRLLRELACACARLDPALAPRVSKLQLARQVERVAPEALSMARRLAGLGVVVELGGLPTVSPGPEAAEAAARRVLSLLAPLEARERSAPLRDALQRPRHPAVSSNASNTAPVANASNTALPADATHTADDAHPRRADHQPTAAPSLRDSLAPR